MNDVLIDKLMETPRIKSLGLKRDSVVDILKAYDDISINMMLERGNIDLGNGINMEVVQLIDRVHVLRGIPYKASRKYKLKINMGDEIYNRIEKYYDRLREDIL